MARCVYEIRSRRRKSPLAFQGILKAAIKNSPVQGKHKPKPCARGGGVEADVVTVDEGEGIATLLPVYRKCT